MFNTLNEKKEKEIEEAAYFIAQQGKSYEELCWILAESELTPKKLVNVDKDEEDTDSLENALKFFHNWINQCIEIGGANLPKTISSLLGSKLAKLYKDKGITDIGAALKKSYEVIKGASEITQKDPNTIEIRTKYEKPFCPIGGKNNPENSSVFNESICYPYTMGFLSELDPRYKYSAVVQECILTSGKNVCRFTLNLEEKPK